MAQVKVQRILKKIRRLRFSATLGIGAHPKWRLKSLQTVREAKQNGLGDKLSGTKMSCIIIRSIAYQSRQYEY